MALTIILAGLPGLKASGQDPFRGIDDERVLPMLRHLSYEHGGLNVPAVDGRVLFDLVREKGYRKGLEIGTSNGYSGLWFCLALRTTGGKLTTHEIDSNRAQLARENFKRAGVEDMVTLVEGNAHDTVTQIKEPIDILFIDADKPGYPDYLNKLLPLVRPGGLILSHNIDSTSTDYVKAITTDPNLETIQAQGVTITLKKRQDSTSEAKEN